MKSFDELKALPDLTVEPDRVVMTGGEGLAETVIYDGFGYPDSEELEAAEASFLEQFEVVGPRLMGDPREDFYQGVTFISVIRRKADGHLFGYEHWEPVAKHAEGDLTPNGDDQGFEVEWDTTPDRDGWWDEIPSVFVWLPVEPFTITGYSIVKP